jgi:hypothetical protein
VKTKHKNLDKYNLKICINKLRDMLIERSNLNRQLDELIVEYKNLELNKYIDNIEVPRNVPTINIIK